MGAQITIQAITKATPQLCDNLSVLVSQLGPAHQRELTIEHIEEVIKSPTNTLLIAENEEGDAIGMLLMISFPAVTGYKTWIEDVIVDEKHRRQGIAKALFDEAISLARTKKLTHINLTVRPHRAEANELYAKLGFEPHETNYYRYVL